MSENTKMYSNRGKLTGGIILLGIGLIFFLSNINLLPDIEDSWPLFLIVIGIAMLYGATKDRSHRAKWSQDSPAAPGDTTQSTQSP